MAMTTCRECGKEVSDGAATCPNCGVAKPWKRAKQPARISKPVAALAVATVIVVVVWAGSIKTAGGGSGSEIVAGTLGTEGYVAKEYCRKAGTMQLKAPATAKWGDASTEYLEDLGKGRYHVQLQVDAQNGFGALLRTTIDCKLTLASDSVRAITVKSWQR